jgi:uncharacterized glyoxalase superfamily protein PhnB
MAKFISITPNLMVKKVSKSIEFYRNKLGFHVAMSVPDDGESCVWAMMECGQVVIMLQDSKTLKAEYDVLDANADKKTLSLFIKIEDLDEYFEKIASHVDVLKEPSITPYGMKEFAIIDPDGYVLTFAEE